MENANTHSHFMPQKPKESARTERPLGLNADSVLSMPRLKGHVFIFDLFQWVRRSTSIQYRAKNRKEKPEAVEEESKIAFWVILHKGS